MRKILFSIILSLFLWIPILVNAQAVAPVLGGNASATLVTATGASGSQTQTLATWEAANSLAAAAAQTTASAAIPSASAITASAAPSPVGNFNSVTTACTGDIAKMIGCVRHSVTGAATLGQPTSGYTQYPDSSALMVYGYNSSGVNYSTSGNSGRTGLANFYFKSDQYGQGDFTNWECFGGVYSTLLGATNYLASPETACGGGSLTIGAAGAYVEFLGDMNISDTADGAGVGAVWNFTRSYAAEGLGAVWSGLILQSKGAQPIDSIARIAGPWAYGFDLSNANLSYYRAAGITVSGGGAGYAVGDLITVSGGTAIAPTVLQVATLSGSAVATVSVVNTGIYSVAPVTGYVTLTTTTSGSGAGAVLSGQYLANNAIIFPSTGGCILGSASTGATNTEFVGISNTYCASPHGVTIGGRNNVNTSAPSNSNDVAIGDKNTQLGSNTIVRGTYAYDEAQNNVDCYSSGSFTGAGGQSQTCTRIFRGIATGTTSVRLTGDLATASTQNSYLVPSGSAHAISIKVQAIDETNGDSAIWQTKQGEVSRVSGGNATYQGNLSSAGAPDLYTGAGSTATMQISADTTNQALNITFVPPTSNAHTWHVQAIVVGDQIL